MSMMRGAAVWLSVVMVGALACLVEAAPLFETTPLQGLLALSAPVRAQEILSGDGAERFVLDWRQPQPTKAHEVYWTPKAEMTIIEDRNLRNPSIYAWPMAFPSDAPQVAPGPGGKTTTTPIYDVHASVQPRPAGPALQHWLAYTPGASSQPAGFRTNGTCALATSPMVVAPFEGRAISPGSPNASSRSRPSSWVTADCGARDLNVTGAVSVLAFNVTLRLDYAAENGSRASRTITTGHFQESVNHGRGALVEEGTRTAILRSNQTSLRMEIEGNRLKAGGFAMASRGTVDIPPWKGNLTWGDWTLAASESNLTTQGTFLFRAKEKYLDIDGWTVDRPVPLSSGAVWPGVIVSVAVAAGAAALALAWRRLRWALYGLFSRLDQSEVLNQPARRALFDLVKSNPGIRVKDAARSLGLSRRAADHHAAVLVRQGMVEADRFMGESGLFPKGFAVAERRRILVAHKRAVQAVLGALAADAALSQDALAERLGFSIGYLSRVMQKLEGVGLVQRRRGSRRRLYVLTPS